MNYILLLIGFVLLVKGADIFIENSSAIAKSFKIPPFVIGLTIVAFGTSTPEASVSITSALKGQSGLAIGNIIGSNIFNLLIVVGISGFIKNLYVDKSIIHKEFPFLILSSVILFLLTFDIFLQDDSLNTLGRFDGIILLILFIIFMYFLIKSSKSSKHNSYTKDSSINSDGFYELNSNDVTATVYSKQSTLKNMILCIFSIVFLILGGKFVADSSISIALDFGISDKLIGLTIVSIGTSLPEFVTSIIAAIKGESSIALGNVIGSNIFNILFILGISAFVSPLTINCNLYSDYLLMIFVTILTYLFAIKKRDINILESFILITIYICYMYYLLITA